MSNLFDEREFDEILELPSRLESIPQDDILEAIKDGSHTLWRDLTKAVQEEDESEIGYLICQMVWAYKKQYGI